MFAKTKIALTAALVLGSASGAFAGGYNNVGEIETPMVPAVHSSMVKGFTVRHATRADQLAAQRIWSERSTRYISSY